MAYFLGHPVCPLTKKNTLFCKAIANIQIHGVTLFLYKVVTLVDLRKLSLNIAQNGNSISGKPALKWNTLV